MAMSSTLTPLNYAGQPASRRGYQQGELFSFRDWFDGDARVARSLRWATGGADESGRGACLETLAGVGRLGHEKLFGPAVSAASSRRRSPNAYPGHSVAASADTPESDDARRQVAASGASSTHPGFTCWALQA